MKRSKHLIYALPMLVILGVTAWFILSTADTIQIISSRLPVGMPRVSAGPIESPPPVQFDRAEAYQFYRSGLDAMNDERNLDAIENFDRYIEVEDRNPRAYRLRAIVLRRLDRYEASVADLDTALALSDSDADLYYQRSISERLLGDFAIAKDDLQTALKLGYERDASLYRDLGTINNGLGLRAEALDNFSDAIRLQSDNADYWYRRAMTYREVGRDLEAISDFTTAISLDSTDERFPYFRGLLYRQLGDYPRAIDDFSTVIELTPQDARGYYQRHIAYEQTGESELANADYETARRIDPDFVDASE